VVLLALSGFGISIFRTHAWPGGPLTFAGISLAGAWLLWERPTNPVRALRRSPARAISQFRQTGKLSLRWENDRTRA